MAIPPGTRVGRYEVVRKLGQGGFGILYVARDVELDREVALKFLRPEHVTRADVVQRFLQEARSAAKIQHAGIVTVFECGQLEHRVYIAMELLQGENLGARLKREGKLAPELAINIVRQVCSALMAAHTAGIVHRDLKPDNLFLVADSAVRGNLRVKILDFGVAKLADGQFDSGVRTHSAMLLGTPMYMSPEQCRSSAKVDHRSDIYAVGCILYQLLCGRAPYEGDAGELIAKHQLAAIPPVRALAPELPQELEDLVTQMLAKTPDERPATMAAVEDRLATFEPTPSANVVPRAPTLPPVPPSAPPAPAPETSATTLFQGIGEQTRRQAQPSRRVMIGGALAVIAFGVFAGVLVTRGDDRDPAPKPAPVARMTPVPASDPPPPPETVVVEVPAEDVAATCERLRAERAWPALVECGDKLATTDPERGRSFHDLGVAENKAEATIRKLASAVQAGDFIEARRLHELVPASSVYARDAADLYARVTAAPPSKPKAKAKTSTTTVADDAECDAEKHKKKGDDYLSNGMDTAALAQFEASLRCKRDLGVLKLAFLAACRSKNATKARAYFNALPAAQQNAYAQICLRSGVAVP